MARRRTAVLLTLVVLAAACGDGAARPGTGDTSGTSVPGSTTTTAPSPTTTPAPACDAGGLPDGLDEVAWVLADADGDGREDRLVAYRVGDVTRLWVELAGGGTVSADMFEPPGPLPVEPIGGHDLDGDGTEELFATVGAGAYTFLVGVWTLEGCRLERLVVDGLPAAFPVGASASNAAGLRCPESGGLETVEAASLDGVTYQGGFRRYEMAGTSLVAGERAPAIFEGGEIPGVAGFSCGDFGLDVLP